jgi:DNA-binding NarL/FixJ family response regulator
MGNHACERPDRPRLLIADDDAFMREFLRITLRDDFDCVVDVDNAPDAVREAARLRPDLALLDLNMPGGGAHAATPAIRACSPATAVVILSSDDLHSEVVSLLAAGAVAYLLKGIDRRTLTDRLLASISAHRLWGHGPYATAAA